MWRSICYRFCNIHTHSMHSTCPRIWKQCKQMAPLGSWLTKSEFTIDWDKAAITNGWHMMTVAKTVRAGDIRWGMDDRHTQLRWEFERSRVANLVTNHNNLKYRWELDWTVRDAGGGQTEYGVVCTWVWSVWVWLFGTLDLIVVKSIYVYINNT